MDDVVLMSNKTDELQKMLDITNEIANRYKIVFGEEKSNIISTGHNNGSPEPLLGNMTIKQTDSYKYLGQLINKKNTLEDHIHATERKIEGAYQTILNIAKDENFRGIRKQVIWEMVEKCLVPITMPYMERTGGKKRWRSYKRYGSA